MNYLKMYLVALIIFLATDSIWLGLVSKNLYKNEIGHLMTRNPNYVAAIIFYIVFLIGLVYFVINPAIEAKDIIKLLISSSLFGLITYATYDLTNLATLQNWPIKITIIDLLWGTFLSVIVSVATYYIYNIL